MPVVLNARSTVASQPAIRLGLVNNMPDAALARTERQFIDILEAAAPDLTISLCFFSVPGIVRGELGQAHLTRHGYRSTADIAAEGLDAVIVTGTEPKQANLRNEPYWQALATLFDWIAQSGPSAIFFCLAAHAAVLHFDGIERQRMPSKRCGLFEHAVVASHPLVKDLTARIPVAHSRWNEVRRETLEEHGYQILTASPEAGVDLFLKPGGNPLLFFQGHPEYDGGTLFREYRRDVQRFLTGATDTYPAMPQSYFDATETDLLDAFRAGAMATRDETLLDDFPVRRSVGDNAPVTPMARVFGAWLLDIAAQKAPVIARPEPRVGGIYP